YWQVVQYLRTSLPPPATDAPEDLARRDRAAIAEVASLLPGTAAEATLAAQYVAANAQAMDALRELRAHAADPSFAMKCNAQSASMMRQARGAIGTLQRMQDRRRKMEANAAAASQAVWAEHCAAGLMMQELPGAAPVELPEPPAAPPPPEPEPAEPPAPDPVAEAELYAAMYPDRAALIRRHGGVPKDARFGPPEPYVERALVHGRSPALLALDRRAG
ncbi:MAG TPA: hypothetical protein VFL55_23420, partial [Acetobacteraceae bacterium]|nr:hypothetical protein [Acetobacteraceae bacterium]